MKNTKKERLTPEQLDANYKKLMKGKELNYNGKIVFEKTLNKAVPKTKSRSSK